VLPDALIPHGDDLDEEVNQGGIIYIVKPRHVLLIDMCARAKLLAKLCQLDPLSIEITGGRKHWAGGRRYLWMAFLQLTNGVRPMRSGKATK
jgi:hypothetical protein